MFASAETADELVGRFVFTLTDLNKCLYLPNHHRIIVLQCTQPQQFARFRATTTTGVVAHGIQLGYLAKWLQKMHKTFTGGCLCGNIRFEAINPLHPHTCSCDICQKHTGALTAMWFEFTKENVKWTGEGGVPSTFRSSAYSSRSFCSRCGSSVGAIDDEPTLALLAGGFDEGSVPELPPVYHSFDDMAPAWWRSLFFKNRG